MKNFFGLGEVFGYFFRKSPADIKPNRDLKAMHFVNKLSIVVFLAGVIYLVIRNW